MANIEHRRIDGGGGGWPHTLSDVIAAIVAVRRDRPGHATRPSVAVGHSAGGQLAILGAVAARLTAVAALAPITDPAWYACEALGEGATESFMLADPQHASRNHLDASPITALTAAGVHLIAHGGDLDARVPVEHSRDHVRAVRAAGMAVNFQEIAEADHFQLSAAWTRARSWINAPA
ncbi:MAG: prolyl oligopeptidase family serine peptidase [Microbacteriaceae bacterium]